MLDRTKLDQTGMSELTLKTQRQPLPICRSARSSSDIKYREQEVKDIFDSEGMEEEQQDLWVPLNRIKCLTRWLKINILCHFWTHVNGKHLSFYVLMRHMESSTSPCWHNLLDRHQDFGLQQGSETIVDSLRPDRS